MRISDYPNVTLCLLWTQLKCYTKENHAESKDDCRSPIFTFFEWMQLESTMHPHIDWLISMVNLVHWLDWTLESWRHWIQQVIFDNNYKFHVIFAFYDEKLLWKSLLHFITYGGDKGMSEVYLTFGTHRDQRKVFLHAAIDMSHNACHFSTTQRRCSKCGNIFIEKKMKMSCRYE